YTDDGNPAEGVTADDILHRTAALAEFLPYAQNNLSVNANLAWGYKRLAISSPEKTEQLYAYLQNSMQSRKTHIAGLLEICTELTHRNDINDKSLRMKEILKKIRKAYKDLSESYTYWLQDGKKQQIKEMANILEKCKKLLADNINYFPKDTEKK
ncbi:MAG: hypothetical protein LBD99_05380, partial [Candidatus Margulisbacteria bacterium]|nr:hypothetical protein [Candidatus Margulisiibacteriota bacterium]